MDASHDSIDEESALENLPEDLRRKIEAHKEDPDGIAQPQNKKSRREILCEQCSGSQSKYTCPKCAFRSCSVACVKQHKVERLCDGMPQKWSAVAKFSEFNPLTSVRDQAFMHDLKGKILPENSNNQGEQCSTSHELRPSAEARPQQFSAVVNYLLNSTRMRRIWLTVNEEHDTKGSRHEGFSDTIFWTIKVTFVRSATWDWTTMSEKLGTAGAITDEAKTEDIFEKPLSQDVQGVFDTQPVTEIVGATITGDVEDGELPSDNEDGQSIEFSNLNQEQNLAGQFVTKDMDVTIPKLVEDLSPKVLEDESELISHSYVVSNIPESLTVRTLIKQFVRPKVYGPVISKSDLDMEKMQPFLKHPDELIAFMPVNCNGTTRFFGINLQRTLLENLRNKFVTGHPELVVLLDQDPKDMCAPTSEEIDGLHQSRRGKHQTESSFQRRPRNNFNNNHRGGFGPRRGAGGHRPQRGGGSNFQNRAPKRHYQPREDPLENILASSSIKQRHIAAMSRPQ